MSLSAGEALENLVANVRLLTGDTAAPFTAATVEGVAHRSGVPRAKVAQVLAGKLYPCPRDLASIANGLGITSHELITEPEPW